MPLVKIDCPFCGYNKEVEKESIPVTAKSITCPKCKQDFPITVIANTVTKTANSTNPTKKIKLTKKDKLLRMAAEFTLGTIVLLAVRGGLSVLNILPWLVSGPAWLWDGAAMRFFQLRACISQIFAYKRLIFFEPLGLLPIAWQGILYLISALVLLLPFIPVIWLCIVIGKGMLVLVARFKSK